MPELREHVGLFLNSIQAGDCLALTRRMPPESVDLIYLDPPFGTGRVFKGRPGSLAAEGRFADTFGAKANAETETDGPFRAAHPALARLIADAASRREAAYLKVMSPRLVELRRLVRPTGNFFLHCDPTMNHVLRVVLNRLFGAKCFRNEIVWRRKQERHNATTTRLCEAHDTILWYAASRAATWRRPFAPHDAAYVARHYRHVDSTGRYATFPCTNEAGGNPPYAFRGITRAWRFRRERMEAMYHQGLLTQATPASPFRYKKYLAASPGAPLDDTWDDIKAVRGRAATGWPTQKPVALLERIVRMGSNEGDLVLDPMCGSGTTLVAAKRLGRRWIGMDVSPVAAEVARTRLAALLA